MQAYLKKSITRKEKEIRKIETVLKTILKNYTLLNLHFKTLITFFFLTDWRIWPQVLRTGQFLVLEVTELSLEGLGLACGASRPAPAAVSVMCTHS